MRLLITTIFGTIILSVAAQPTVGGKGDCFCDNHGRKEGVWYIGPVAGYGITAYRSDYIGEPENQWAVGLRGGTNLTERFSLQVGAMYAKINKVYTSAQDLAFATPGEYYPTVWQRTTFLFPVNLIVRFDSRSRFVPYVSVGVMNEFLLNDHPNDLDKEETTYDEGGGYQAGYLDLSPGIACTLSDKASLFLEAYYRHSVLDLFSKSEQVDNYTKQLGLSLGFNFHF